MNKILVCEFHLTIENEFKSHEKVFTVIIKNFLIPLILGKYN